jgi:hypothetical protein
MLTGNFVSEQFVKIGFGWTSLSIGESFPAISLILPLPLLMLLALSLRRMGVLHSTAGVAVAMAAALGYLAVSRWVSYPFTPARLLWLLPFVVIAWTAGFDAIRPAAARWMFFITLMISHLLSIGNYFERRDYLNPGYSAPLREIAVIINEEAGPEDLVLFDAYNTDGLAIARLLRPGISWMVVSEPQASEARAKAASARNVWIVRNTRDISPGKTTSLVERDTCALRRQTARELHPYADWQMWVMRLIGVEGPPSAFYRVAWCRAPG